MIALLPGGAAMPDGFLCFLVPRIPTTLAVVAAGTHTAAERSRGLAVWSAALVTGGLAAPVLGGWLAEYSFGDDPDGGWKWAFLACLIFAVTSALLSVRADDSSDPVGRSLDWPGQVTIAVALLGLLFAVIQGPTSGWGSGIVAGAFIVAVVFLVLFVLVELRSQAPLLQLRLFAHRPFTAAAIANAGRCGPAWPASADWQAPRPAAAEDAPGYARVRPAAASVAVGWANRCSWSDPGVLPGCRLPTGCG
jgi:Na+/melibiose symporter-like transporter